MSRFDEAFSPKQQEVLNCDKYENPRILITYGAQRAGKTFLDNFLFFMHMRRFANKGVNFIIAGVDNKTIYRNVLSEWEQLLGISIKVNKRGFFTLWGNQVYTLGGANSDDWKSARGFTSAGLYLNEGTALDRKFIQEAIARCSYPGARIYMDTNPDDPMHPVNTDYILKDGDKLQDGRPNIRAFHFSLYDNTFLSKEYIESQEKTTPSGMFFKRNILGLWVPAEGVVYEDFDEDTHLIDKVPEDAKPAYYIGGIDYGYRHLGVSLVVMKTLDDRYYLVDCDAKPKQYMSYWGKVAQKQQATYYGVTFYPDPARPDNNDELRNKYGIRTGATNNSVFEGIQVIGSLLKQKKLFFIKSAAKRLKEEMYLYTWKDVKDGEERVNKINDDVLDALRYAIFSDWIRGRGKITQRPYGF